MLRGMRIRSGTAILTLTTLLGLCASALASPQTGSVSLPQGAGQLVLGAAPNDRLGTSLAAAGDLDGDGRGDLVTGILGGSSTGADTAAGAAFALRGGLSGMLALSDASLPAAAGYAVRGDLDPTDVARAVVGALGDINGDGRPDLPARTWDGRVMIVYGKAGQRPTVTLGTVIAPEGGFALKGTAPDAVGSAGDFNGDGLGDIAVVSAGRYEVKCNDAKTVCTQNTLERASLKIVFGRATRTEPVDLAALSAGEGMTVTWPAMGKPLLAAVGDTNGDGFGDVAVGLAETYRVFVFLGGPNPPSFDITNDMPQSRGFTLHGPSASDLGAGVAPAGDVNGDKLADLVVGAPGRGERGTAWIVYGRKLGTDTTLSDTFDAGETIMGPPGVGRRFGSAVAGLGDVNGDGRGDVAIAAPGYAKPLGPTSALPALAYVVRSTGQAGSVTSITSTSTLDPARGFAVTGGATDVGDLTVASAGVGKVAIGVPEGGGARSGAVYVLSTASSTTSPAPLALSATMARPRVRSGSAGTISVATPEPAAVTVRLYRVVSRDTLTPVSTRASLLSKAASGRRTAPFSTRIAGKRLAKGRYVAALRAAAGTRRSLLRTVTFTVR